MPRFVLLALVLGLCLIVWLIASRPALIRGVADGMLVSPHRPDMAVRPAPQFGIIDARRSTVSIAVEHQPTPSRADVWYALYTTKDEQIPPARLIVLFAQARPHHEWHYDAPRPTGFELFKQKTTRHNNTEGELMLYAIRPEQDPWLAEGTTDDAPWSSGSLVCRWRFLLPLWRFAVMVEYREPLPAAALPPDADPAAMAAFEQRAYAAFDLLDARMEDPLPVPSANLPYPPQGISRTRLADMLGPVRANTEQ